MLIVLFTVGNSAAIMHHWKGQLLLLVPAEWWWELFRVPRAYATREKW